VKRLVIAAGAAVCGAVAYGALTVACRMLTAALNDMQNPMFNGAAAAATVNALCDEYAREYGLTEVVVSFAGEEEF